MMLIMMIINGKNRSKKLLELRSILKLPEIKAQIAEGDLSVEDLESVWLEACTVKVRYYISHAPLVCRFFSHTPRACSVC